MKKQLSAEQQAAREAKRAKVRDFAKQISKMTPAAGHSVRLGGSSGSLRNGNLRLG